MLALIQRVSSAKVEVEGETVGQIGAGLLALVCAEATDDSAKVVKMAERLLAYRVFADEAGRMNRSLRDSGGQLLLVSQFTLAADTRSGLRPSFSGAASPALAEQLYAQLIAECRQRHAPGVEMGRFGAHMQVSLVNDGPVTFMLQT
ncbi:D-tyrosyl-tRNA(Tyr) deacylase [Lysobacteraceae bacterium NML75-0749]|nr:D-tyrosyl-tRNA(Tyr) deacylase [Xanthomonadaceae bacterium NML75-0749]PJK06029.1 D-tyrosyl-tRNA(Tyr) deacylase [Xanthomonadaceae bacterium NML91-0268]